MLGPSGCGKTTTLKMIAGFEQPTSGRVLLEGVDVSRVPPYKRNVNTVFQQYALFPHMTVIDNVAFGPRSKRVGRSESDRRVSEMLEVVRLTEFANRKPSQLSGGQQQRVALARALVNLPERAAPRRATRRPRPQAPRGDAVRAQADPARGRDHVRVRHPRPGRGADDERPHRRDERRVVEQIGTPEEIYNRPASLFVAGFIGSANLLPGTVSRSGRRRRRRRAQLRRRRSGRSPGRHRRTATRCR